MFTGLIEEVGKIKSIKRLNKYWEIEISAKKIMADMKLGDSISVDGLCLTVTKMKKNSFVVDVTTETLKKSKVGKYHSGKQVNLERALKVGDRLGGHIVQGHVEGVAKVINFRNRVGTSILEILLPVDLTVGVIPKGFIAIDGISLTVAEKIGRKIRIAVINETKKRTTLVNLKTGATVNIERDFAFFAANNANLR